MGKLTISMAMLNSYVKLPEGIQHCSMSSMIYLNDKFLIVHCHLSNDQQSFCWFFRKAEAKRSGKKKNIPSSVANINKKWEISMISTIHQPFDSFHGCYAAINLHHPLRLWTVWAFVLPGRGYVYRYWVYLWFIGISWERMDLGFIGIWDFASSQLSILTNKNIPSGKQT